MENTDGNTSAPSGLEPANGSGPANDFECIPSSDTLQFAETCIERAQDRLRYGRRQEAEEAIGFLEQARQCIKAARASGEG